MNLIVGLLHLIQVMGAKNGFSLFQTAVFRQYHLHSQSGRMGPYTLLEPMASYMLLNDA